MKLAISGAHGTGKTTLVRALRETGFAATSEVPRDIIGAIGDPSFFRRENNSFERQCLVIAQQIETEAKLEQQGVTMLVSDRSVVDHWAYTELLFPEEARRTPEGNLWLGLVTRWTQTYDFVFYVEPEVDAVDDGVREDSRAFQLDVDRCMRSIYTSLGVQTVMIAGSTDERVERVLTTLPRGIEDGNRRD